jgi:hypothetical protein
MRLFCPARIATDDVATCQATKYFASGATESAIATYSSSDVMIIETGGSSITGINPGSADVTARDGVHSATVTVFVVAGANGSFDTFFNPAFNNCGMPIRSTLAGTMDNDFASGTHRIGGAVQDYALTFSYSGGRVGMVGRHASNGFEYTMTLTQETPRVRRYLGREDIRCPDGRTAQYNVVMQAR